VDGWVRRWIGGWVGAWPTDGWTDRHSEKAAFMWNYLFRNRRC